MKKEQNLSLAIRRIRNNLGFSQGFVAKKLNISQQAYSHMENAPNKMSIDRLQDLSKVLQTDLLELLTEAYGIKRKSRKSSKETISNRADDLNKKEMIRAIQTMGQKLDSILEKSKK